MRRFWGILFCLALCCSLAAPVRAAPARKDEQAVMELERKAELKKLAREKAASRSKNTGAKKYSAKKEGAGKSAKAKKPPNKASARPKAAAKEKKAQPRPRPDEKIKKAEKPENANLVVKPTGAPEEWRGQFARGPVTLWLWPDHFFAMLLGAEKPRSVTGLWKQSADGVRLDLVNAQDLSIGVTRGKKRLYASLGDLDWGAGELERGKMSADPVFQAAGRLEAGGFQDAASGRVFPVEPGAIAGLDLAKPLFATAEIRGGAVHRVLGKGRQFPRTLETLAGAEASRLEGTDFRTNILGRHWLMPSMPGAEKSVIMFLPQENENGEAAEKGPVSSGAVEISGPGVRAEGNFRLEGRELSIRLDEESIRNLEAVGAAVLGKAINGQFRWSAHGSALNLERNGAILRLMAP